ncbi:MAG: PilZ domain-containing protein [Acidobacteria bacterium]|nr:PilZ domain-containing protein [Acidobacteriota bacterium]
MKNTIERRTEDRTGVQGPVILVLSEQGRKEIGARLLDSSRGGFRASHGHPELSAGLVVDFTHQSASGRARVVWTRVLGEQAESGFLILG